jgi:four helix bundle protein
MSKDVRYHTDLRLWQESKELAVKAYAITARFPASELYSLTRQIRRAAASIPANIAEGCGRGTTQELVRSLRIARGSLGELHSHLVLAAEISYLGSAALAPIENEITRIHRMINALIHALRKSSSAQMPRRT